MLKVYFNSNSHSHAIYTQKIASTNHSFHILCTIITLLIQSQAPWLRSRKKKDRDSKKIDRFWYKKNGQKLKKKNDLHYW